MKKPRLPKKFVDKCKAVTAKRPKTVIDHILKHGFITTEELKETYGYNHPPRAARDVREQGIPLETFRVQGGDGRSIGAYRFGDPKKARFSKLSGRTAFSKELKAKLIEADGARCAIYFEVLPERDLQLTTECPLKLPVTMQAIWTLPKITCCSPGRQTVQSHGPANIVRTGSTSKMNGFAENATGAIQIPMNMLQCDKPDVQIFYGLVLKSPCTTN